MASADNISTSPILGQQTETEDEKTCTDIFLDGIKGGSIYISFTVIVLAIVFSMMTVNWTKMLYDEEESKSMVFGVLIFSMIIGNISIFLLCCAVLCTKGPQNALKPESLYERFKLGAAILFALSNLTHCSLYINKHARGSSGCTDKGAAIAYNVFSILYTIMLMCGIFAFKVVQTTVFNKFLSVGILFANFSFWLDTVFSESGELFKYNSDQGKLPGVIGNKTNQNICNYTESAILPIETFDPLLSPGTVEFAIITVDLLFSYAKKEQHHDRAADNENQRNVINIQQNHNSNDNCKDMEKIVIVVLFGICSFALFVTSVVGYIKYSKDEGNETSDTLSPVFKAYIVTSLVVKLAMFFCLSLCTCWSWGSFKYKSGMEGLILKVSCFGNVVYHMFYLFAIWKSYKVTNDGNVRSYLVVSYFENILSIIIAWEQTLFILATESGEKLRTNKHKHRIYFVCLLMTISNFGLWSSASFGVAKVAALSEVIKNNYSKIFWVVFTKLFLRFTIFFRLHSGLILLKMFCNRNALDERNNEMEPQGRDGYGSIEQET